jgi:uncharacterized repeat protein (TIGR01451 family)
MTTSAQNKSSGFFRGALAVMALAALMAYATPASATLGGTSANATIHNVVQVAYKLSSTMTAVNIYAVVDVTVQTVPTTATWYPSTAQTVAGSSTATYSLASTYPTYLRSNANGPDSYSLTNSNGAPVNATAQTAQTVTTATPVWLWGGITTQAAAVDTLYFPGGSVTAGAHPLASGQTVEITVGAVTKRYTVGAINNGNANTQAAGTASNENYATVAVTPVSGLAADHVGPGNFAVPAGTQVGQYAEIDFNVTVGNPTLVGTNGQDLTNLSALGAATDAANNPQPAATTTVTTNITSGALTITKLSRILGSAAPVDGTTNIVPGNYTTALTAKTGQKIEYLITVTNPAGNSPASSATITDPTPAYTTLVAGSQSSAVAANGTTPVTGVTVTAAGSEVWTAGGTTFSNLAGGNSIFIVYQVTVN